MHHSSYLIPDEPSSSSDQYFFEEKYFIRGSVDWFKNPIPTLDAFEKGNMDKISSTIEVNISTTPGVVEDITLGAYFSPEEVTSYKALFQEFLDIFTWSYTEMPGLDPFIVEHRINTWPDVAPVRQNQRPFHPSKVASIKAEIKKLRKAGFIYPIVYTT